MCLYLLLPARSPPGCSWLHPAPGTWTPPGTRCGGCWSSDPRRGCGGWSAPPPREPSWWWRGATHCSLFWNNMKFRVQLYLQFNSSSSIYNEILTYTKLFSFQITCTNEYSILSLVVWISNKTWRDRNKIVLLPLLPKTQRRQTWGNAHLGIITRTQSPVLNLNPGGLLMTRLVTLEGSTTPSWMKVRPLPMKLLPMRYSISAAQTMAMGRNHFQKSGAWSTRRT